jgi:hypothetical protein
MVGGGLVVPGALAVLAASPTLGPVVPLVLPYHVYGTLHLPGAFHLLFSFFNSDKLQDICRPA